MSIDQQSVSNIKSSTMRKRRFRRVSYMFKLRKVLTRRERKKNENKKKKKKKNFDLTCNYTGRRSTSVPSEVKAS